MKTAPGMSAFTWKARWDVPAQKLDMTMWEKGGKVFNTRQVFLGAG